MSTSHFTNNNDKNNSATGQFFYDIAQEEVKLPCINLNISSNILLQVQNGKAVL